MAIVSRAVWGTARILCPYPRRGGTLSFKMKRTIITNQSQVLGL